MRIFDCHSHWGTRRGYLFRTEADLAKQEQIWKTPVQYYTEQEQAEYFRQNQVRAILDLSWTKSLPIEQIREHNDYIFAYQRANPDVVFGHWLQFDPAPGRTPVADALAELDRALAANAGFVGVCVNGQVTGMPASDPVWDPFYRRCVDAGLPVMILVGLTGIGQGQAGGHGILLDHGHPRHVDAVAARYPGLQILAARPAYPWQDEMIAILLHKANVSYELHGWSPRHFQPSLKAEIRGRLQDRVMFGCDFPVLRYERVLATWQAEGYSDDILEKILFQNAERYFAAGAPKPAPSD